MATSRSQSGQLSVCRPFGRNPNTSAYNQGPDPPFVFDRGRSPLTEDDISDKPVFTALSDNTNDSTPAHFSNTATIRSCGPLPNFRPPWNSLAEES